MSGRGRRWLAIGATLGVLITAVVVVYWRETHFDARREAMTDARSTC